MSHAANGAADARQLIQRIVREPGDRQVDQLANQLLRAFQNGYPVDALRELLASSDQRVVAIGAWIASELEFANALLPDVVALLGHVNRKVRFFTINALLLWLRPTDTDEFAAVLTLLDDPDSAVRWKVLQFLSLVSDEHLRASRDHLRAEDVRSPYIAGLELLVHATDARPAEIATALAATDPLVRKFAAAAAARRARALHDQQALAQAASSDDADVHQFADDMLRLTSRA